jgi:hypothetical protein
MDPLPVVTAAEYRGGYRIHLVFSDGTESAVDFSSWLVGPIFEPLESERYLLDGGTVTWPDGADIAPEALHERAESSRAA